MNILNLPLHTIIICAGSSYSQKEEWSHAFSKQVNTIDKRLTYTTITGLASDNVSENVLKELKNALTFPNNKDFVIVDSNNTSENFYTQVIELAKKYSYSTMLVAFSYEDNAVLANFSGQELSIAQREENIFKKKVLPNIKLKSFNYNYRVKDYVKDVKNLSLKITNYDVWNNSNISVYEDYDYVAVIGDVHEHVEALRNLINKLPEKTLIVFVGDLFDKGNQTELMLDFAEELVAKKHKIVVGNHESFVARRLKKEISKISNENELFPSLKVFMNNQSLADRFLKIYDNTLPFARILTNDKPVYVTHAPCYNNYLGKLDEKSQKFQRNFYFTNRDPAQMEKDLKFIQKESNVQHPLHIFGHVANDMQQIVERNKIWLDTGAVYGNLLTAVLIDKLGNTSFVKVSTNALTQGKLFKKEGRK